MITSIGVTTCLHVSFGKVSQRTFTCSLCLFMRGIRDLFSLCKWFFTVSRPAYSRSKVDLMYFGSFFGFNLSEFILDQILGYLWYRTRVRIRLSRCLLLIQHQIRNVDIFTQKTLFQRAQYLMRKKTQRSNWCQIRRDKTGCAGPFFLNFV